MRDSVFWLPTNIDHMWEEMMQQVSSKYYFNILVQTITSRCIRSLFIILRGALPGLVVSGSCGGTGGKACLACPRLQGRDTPPAAETPLMTLRLSSPQLKYQYNYGHWSLILRTVTHLFYYPEPASLCHGDSWTPATERLSFLWDQCWSPPLLPLLAGTCLEAEIWDSSGCPPSSWLPPCSTWWCSWSPTRTPATLLSRSL